MNWLRHLWVDFQLTWRIFWQEVILSSSLGLWLLLSATIIFILQWLFNVRLFWEILTTGSISFSQKIDFFWDGFLNVFRYIDDLIPISLILIGIMQAAAIVLLIKMRQIKKQAVRNQAGSLALGVVGAGCVACGGSVLTPLLGAVAGNLSLTLAERISDILLLLAVILSYRALSKVSLLYAQQKVSYG